MFPIAGIFRKGNDITEQWRNVYLCLADLYVVLAVLCVITFSARICTARIAGLPFRRSHVAFLLLLTLIVGCRTSGFHLLSDFEFWEKARSNRRLQIWVIIVPALASSSVFSILVFHVGVVLRTIYVAYEQVLHSSFGTPDRTRHRWWCRYWFICCGKAYSTPLCVVVFFNVVMWGLFFASSVLPHPSQANMVLWLFYLSVAIDVCIAGTYSVAALRLKQRLKVLGQMLEPRVQVPSAARTRQPSFCVEISSSEFVQSERTTSSTRERIEDIEEERHAAIFSGGRAAPLAPRTSSESSHSAVDTCLGFDVGGVSPPWSIGVLKSRDADVSVQSTISGTNPTNCTMYLSATHYTDDRRCQAGDVDAMCFGRVATWPSLLPRKDRFTCGSREGLSPADGDVHLSDALHGRSRGISELSLRRRKSLPWCFRYAGKDADRAASGRIEHSETFNSATTGFNASSIFEHTSFFATNESESHGDGCAALGDLGAVVSGLRLILILILTAAATFVIRGILVLDTLLTQEGIFLPQVFFIYITICEWAPYTTLLILYLVPGIRAACAYRAYRAWRRAGNRESFLETTY
eukprot:TRINITY_DN11701_c0_g1_i1.p1 TRINITY_DN11701_c0_g1~~TRINITY_DN11701_c0_g1_i1.p1  ORF type:complete len:579 (+),score=70.75 TRINITY_DN11701_c0_g1_i1:230-1966(+)